MARNKTFLHFARTVLGRRYTPAQTVLVRVAIDAIDPIDLPEPDRGIARQLFGDVDRIPPAARRMLVWYLGRNSFKSGLAVDVSLWRICVTDCSSYGPGEVPLVLVAALALRTSRLMVRRAVELVKATPALAGLLESETADGFVLRRPDGARVGFEAVPASRGGETARGKPILAFIIDESDFCYTGDGYSRTDADMVSAAMPRLRLDGFVLLITTPWAEDSLARRLNADNFGAPETALVAVGSTLLLRDNDPEVAASVAAEMAADPDNARREFFCEFTTNGATKFFSDASIARAIAGYVALYPRYPRDCSCYGCAHGMRGHIGIGCDFGFTRNSSVLCVVHRREHHYQVATLCELRPEKDQALRPSEVVRHFAALIAPYSKREVIADKHQLESLAERFREHGLTLEPGPEGSRGKSDVFTLTKILLDEGSLTFEDNPRLARQFKDVIVKQTSGGGLTITSPQRRDGSHGDMVSALTMAVWAASPESHRSQVIDRTHLYRDSQ